MANKILNTRVISRRDSSSNWASSNPVLLNGERILVDFYDSGTYRYSREKIGDGVKAYNQLPFMDEGFKVPHSHSVTTADDGIVLLNSEVTSDGGHKISASHVEYLDKEISFGLNGSLKIPKGVVTTEGHVKEIEDVKVVFTDDKPSITVYGSSMSDGMFNIDVQHGNMYGADNIPKYMSGIVYEEIEDDSIERSIILKDYFIPRNTDLNVQQTNIPVGETVYLNINGVVYSTVTEEGHNGYSKGTFGDSGFVIDDVDGTAIAGRATEDSLISAYTLKDVVPVYDSTNSNQEYYIGADNPYDYNKITVPTLKIDGDGHVLKVGSQEIYFDMKETKIVTDDRPSISVYDNKSSSSNGVTSFVIEHGDMYGNPTFKKHYSGFYDNDPEKFSLIKNVNIINGEDWTVYDPPTIYEQVSLSINGVEYSGEIDEHYGEFLFGGIISLKLYGVDMPATLTVLDDTGFDGAIEISLYKYDSVPSVYNQASETDDAKNITITPENNTFRIPHFSVEENGHVTKAENIKYIVDFPEVDIPNAIDITTSDDKPSIIVTKETVNNNITLDVQHGNMYGMDVTASYTSDNFDDTKISIAPGEKKSFKVPALKIEKDGHVFIADNKEIEIEVPSKIDYDAVDYLGVIDVDEYFETNLQDYSDAGAKNGDFLRVYSGGTATNLFGEVFDIHSGDLIIALGSNPTGIIDSSMVDPPTEYDGVWGVIHCHNTDNVSSGFKTELNIDTSKIAIEHKELDNTNTVISSKYINFIGSNHISVTANSSTNTFTISDNISDLTSAEIKSAVQTAFGVTI